MRLSLRPATPDDIPALVALYDRAYRGGYSACFDRYGPVGPQEFWWVQSEKEVRVVELNGAAAGMLVTARSGVQLLVEELVLDTYDDAVLARLHQHLVRQGRDEGQPSILLRAHEGNAAALALARAFEFVFANALIVAAHSTAALAAQGADGYAVRRATGDDARTLAGLYSEIAGERQRPEDVAAVLRRAGVRATVAEREGFTVGFVLAESREGGVGTWALGVLPAHRRKGVGRRLAAEACAYFRRRHLRPVVTYWAADASQAGFARALGFSTERTYLYLERPL